MKRIKKIHAFTLTEMLVVLAITTIIAGLAFAILRLFTKNIHNIENNYSSSTELNLFRDQLSVDFNKYPTVKYNPLDRELKFKNPLDSVTYIWDENVVQRKKDTVLKFATDPEFYNVGEKTESGNIDAIKINFDKKNDEDYIFIYQIKDAYSYINDNGD